VRPPEPAADVGDYVRAVEHVRDQVAEAHAQVPSDAMPAWTIYESPKDQPGLVVARLWLLRPLQSTETLLRGNTVAEVRDLLPPGLARLPREPGDDPCIVETWL
jgi:hypothetical protein